MDRVFDEGLDNEIIVRQIYNMQLLQYTEPFVMEISHQNDWRLLCVYNGQVETLLRSGWVTLHEGHLVLIPSDVDYGLRTNGKTHPQVLLISMCVGGSSVQDLTKGRFHLTTEIFEKLNELVIIGESAFNIKAVAYQYDQFLPNKILSSKTRQILKNKLELILLELMELTEREDSDQFPQLPPTGMLSKQMLVNNANEYLTLHLSDTITLQQLSRAMNVSPSYLSNIYRSSTGKSIIATFNEMKIEKAKSYMEQNLYSITQISEWLGFSSIHYFSRAFKNITGLSPTQYLRKEHGSVK